MTFLPDPHNDRRPTADPDLERARLAGTLARLRLIGAALARGTTVAFAYTNHRGESARRVVVPRLLWYGSTEYHPTPGWLLDAWDVHKGACRSFAVDGIDDWTDTP